MQFAVANILAQQCNDINISSVVTKDTYCGNDGAIEVTIGNPEEFSGITYSVVDPVTGTVVVPPQTVNHVMSGLIPGNYKLIVSANCLLTGFRVSAEADFTIQAGVREGAAFSASINQSKSKMTSFNSYNSGKIVVNLTGGSKSYVIELLETPASYTGPTLFLTKAQGEYAIDGLAPSPNAPATQEYYKLRISDGCDVFYYDKLLIRKVTNDLPEYTANMYARYIYTTAKVGTSYEYYPTNEYKKLWVGPFSQNTPQFPNAGLSPLNGDGTVNLNDFFNKTDAKDYYEVGFSYSNNPSTIPDDKWYPVTNLADFVFEGNLYYSQIFADKDNPNKVGNSLPYVILRLKKAPSVYKVFDKLTFSSPGYLPQYAVTPTATGLTLTFRSFQSTPVTLPYKIDLVHSSNPSLNKTLTVTTQIYPEISVDWGTGSYSVYINGVSGGGGDEGMAYKLANLNVKSKDEFFNDITWKKMLSMGTNAGINFGHVSVRVEARTAESLIPIFYKVVVDPISPPSPVLDLPAQYVIENTQGDNTSLFHLTSSKVNASESNSKPIPVGSYSWSIKVYDSSNNLVSDKTLSYTVPDAGSMDVNMSAPFDVVQKPATCYGKKFVLSKSQLANLITRTPAGGSTSPAARSQVRIGFFKETGASILTSNTRISPSNFSFTSTVSLGDFTLEELYTKTGTSLPAGTDPEFDVLESGNYVIRVLPKFIPVGELSGVDGYSTSYFSNQNYAGVHREIRFTVTEEELGSIQLDEKASGAYRCKPETLGSAYIKVTSTAPDGPIQYNIIACDETGAATGEYNHSMLINAKEYSVTDIPVGVDYVRLEIAPETCVSMPSVYIVPIYSLKTSSLLGYSGGRQCEDGDTSPTILPLKLWATLIPYTQYKWYYPDGTEVESMYYDEINQVTIPASKFQAGFYKCDITNTTSCSTDAYEHTVYVAADGSRSYYWAIDAINSNWNYVGNWRTTDGQIPATPPDECVNVVIPGKVNTVYPNLQTGATIGVAKCRDIVFRYGSQVYRTDKLNYKNAYVEYNFKYYGSALPTDDTTPQQPALNVDEGTQPEGGGVEVTGLPAITRNRWWMISAPLKDLYIADFQMNGKPFTFSGLYNNVTNNVSTYVTKLTPSDNESISVVANNDISINSINNAMMLWVPAFTFAKGGSQDDLEVMKGKMVQPYKGSTISQFDIRSLTPRVSGIVAKTNPNRFIYEDASNLPGTGYTLTITPDVQRVDGLVMIGNPFMAAINLYSFYEENQAVIEDSFKIWTGSAWEEITSTSVNNNIGPLQGFVIKLKNPAVANTVYFDYETIFSPVTIGSQIKPR